MSIGKPGRPEHSKQSFEITLCHDKSLATEPLCTRVLAWFDPRATINEVQPIGAIGSRGREGLREAGKTDAADAAAICKAVGA